MKYIDPYKGEKIYLNIMIHILIMLQKIVYIDDIYTNKLMEERN